MSARSSRRTRGATPPVDPQMRISDADRADVADRLSQHYSDGRLDQPEFNERLDRAMKAKTQADLAGLFTDLPPVAEPAKAVKAVQQQDRRPRNRRPLTRTLGLILVVVVAVIVARALTWPLFSLVGFFGHALFVPIPWIVIGLIAFLCWRYVARRRDRS
jgi:Domain of unknown function (DUF1707)